MAIEHTSMWQDVTKIVNSGYKTGMNSAYSSWELIIHTTTVDFKVMKILNVDMNCDFVNNFSDLTTVVFSMDTGEYAKYLYPNVRNLEATLLIQYNPTGSSNSTNTVTTKQRFKAVFLPDSNAKFKGSMYDITDTSALSYTDFTTVSLQLINRSIEPLQLSVYRGISRGYRNDDIIRAAFADQTSKILVDGKKAVSVVDIRPSDNQTPNAHTIIPSSTPLLLLPTYIHEKMNGLYNAGVGTYVTSYKEKTSIFVYPTHNYNKTDSDRTVLMVYSVPENRLGGIDVTFKVDSKTVSIVGYSSSSFTDPADTTFMEEGSGFRMTSGTPIMDKPVEMTVNGPVASRKKLNYEVATLDRADNFNLAKRSSNVGSDNPFKEYSKVNKRSGSVVRVIWTHANHNLIYPGMPAFYSFVSQGSKQKLKATVIQVHYAVMFEDKGLKASRYRTTAVVSLFVENIKG